MNKLLSNCYWLSFLLLLASSCTGKAQHLIPLSNGMIFNLSARGESNRLVDQQQLPMGKWPKHGQAINGGFPWDKNSFVSNGWNRSFIGDFNATHVYQNLNLYYPIEIWVDLGQETTINNLCLSDLHGEGQLKVSIGKKGEWQTIFDGPLSQTFAWNCQTKINKKGQYLQLIFGDPSANIGEILLNGKNTFTPTPPLAKSKAYPIMKDFMGVNINTEDPPNLMALFETVREYHDWQLELGEKHPSDCNSYQWNPSSAYEGWHFDRIYQDLIDNNIEIAADLKSSIPALLEFTVEDKPIAKGSDPLLPASYTAHAEYMYQFAARYGRQKIADKKIQQRIGETPQSGLNKVKYVEDWNEQDKYWMSGTGTPQQEAAYFSPFEYAAMLSADYDGHESSLQMKADGKACTGQTLHPVGVKNADHSMQVVMGGLSSLNLDYIKSIHLWAKLHRNDRQFPADVLNFHHYSNNYGGQTSPPTATAKGVSPEDDQLYEKLKAIVDYRNQYLPSKALWLSEFGYDLHPESPQRAQAIGSFSAAQVQGQWIVRSFLAVAAAGFDKAQLFTLTDNYKGNPAQLFSTCGLLELAEEQDPFTPFPEFAKKQAWYDVYTMKQVLGEFRFDRIQVHSNPQLRIYRFVHSKDASKKVYVLWSATSKDHRIKNIQLKLDQAATSAHQINLKLGDIGGRQQKLTLSNQSIDIAEVSESPIFIVVNDAAKPFSNCDCSIRLDTSMISSEDQPMQGNPYHLIDEQFLKNGQVRQILCGELGKVDQPWVQTNGGSDKPMTAIFDLKKPYLIKGLSVFDLFNQGWLRIEYGTPDNWQVLARYQTYKYNEWKSWLNLNIETQYLRIIYEDPKAIIGELLLCGHPIN